LDEELEREEDDEREDEEAELLDDPDDRGAL